MPDSAHRVRLEGVDFSAAFPTLRLFESFRMALQPTKLVLALLMLLLVYFGGVGLDLVWGQQQGEGGDYYVFERFVQSERLAFEYLIHSAVRLETGLGTLAGDGIGAGGTSEGGMFGALLGLVVAEPAWLWSHHPAFFVVLVVYFFVIKTILGGAIARLAATQACEGLTVGLLETARFTWPRAVWFVVSPLIPLLIAGVIWLVLAVSGAVLFNVPGLNVVGGLLFGLMLGAGFIAACCVIFAALGAGILPSAMAVEGTDAFDVVSRVFTFLLYRPLRYLVLSLVLLIYGALTYLIVGLIVFLTLWFTRSAAGVWVGDFDQLLPLAEFGQPLAAVDTAALSTTQRATSWLVRASSALLYGVWIAYAVSYFFTAQTWLYLLLRQQVDGSAFAEYFPQAELDQTKVPSSSDVKDKVEAAQTDSPANTNTTIDTNADTNADTSENDAAS